jgi:hypothetical protein
MTIGPFSARGRTASYVSNLFRKETFIDDHNHFEGDDNGKMDSNQKKIFYASCISLFTMQNLFLTVETIIPIYIEKTHAGLSPI